MACTQLPVKGAQIPVCEELEDEVEKLDKKIKAAFDGKGDSKTKTRCLKNHKKTTVTASRGSCKPRKMPAYSFRSNLPTKIKKDYASGIKKGDSSNMCKKKDGEEFKYTNLGFKSSCQHTEARLIEETFKENEDVSNCKIVMRIRWKQTLKIKNPVTKKVKDTMIPTSPSDDACPQCEKAICHAISCGLEIELCKGLKGAMKKEPPPCDEN